MEIMATELSKRIKDKNILNAICLHVKKGEVYGTLKYTLSGTTLREVPLVADRDIEKGNIFSRFFGSIEYALISKFLTKE